MSSRPPWLPGEPFVSAATVTGAVAALTACWAITLSRGGELLSLRDTVVLLCLVGAVLVTYRFPLAIGPSSKVYLSSTALYLIACLFVPAVAAGAAAVGILAGELSVSKRTGNLSVMTIIPTQIARWTMVVLVGSLAAHAAAGTPAARYAVAGIVIWAADIVTGPLLLSPLLDRNPAQIMTMMLRQGGAYEAAQYLIGFLGALEAQSRPWALSLLALPAAVVYVAFKRLTDRTAQTRRLLEDMSAMIDAQSDGGPGHSRRVAELTRGILDTMGVPDQQAEVVVLAARLHDLGKAGVPRDLLAPARGLSATEQALVRTHSEKGADLLSRHADLADCATIVRHCHEAWDGSGYPDSLTGDQIPLGSRVIAVADAYDTLTHGTHHTPAGDRARAAALLTDGSGSVWDPKVVEALLQFAGDEVHHTDRPSLVLVNPSGDKPGGGAH